MDYSAILRRSWELTKKNKWLWIYGLVLAVFGGGGGSGGGGSWSPDKNTPSIPSNLPKNLPEKTSKVLGDATSALQSWFSTVPIQTWILLGIGVLLLVLVGIIIGLVIQNWAKGGLIAGFDEADNEKIPTLRGTSQKGIASMKNLLLFSIISFFVAFGLIIGFFLITAILVGGGYLLFGFSKQIQTIWLILGIIAAVLTFVVLVMLLVMIGIYADRLIVLENAAPWAAWKQGLGIARKKFFPTIIMGVLNTLVGCSAGCLSTIALLIILGIPAIILIVPLFRGGSFHWPNPLQAGTILSLFALFVYLHLAVRAVLVVFNYGTWNLFFKEVNGDGDHER